MKKIFLKTFKIRLSAGVTRVREVCLGLSAIRPQSQPKRRRIPQLCNPQSDNKEHHKPSGTILPYMIYGQTPQA